VRRKKKRKWVVCRTNRAEAKWAPQVGAGASGGYKGRSTIKQENNGPERYEITGAGGQGSRWAGGQVPSGHPYSSSIYGMVSTYILFGRSGNDAGKKKKRGENDGDECPSEINVNGCQ
jgi:hypothetical protein